MWLIVSDGLSIVVRRSARGDHRCVLVYLILIHSTVNCLSYRLETFHKRRLVTHRPEINEALGAVLIFQFDKSLASWLALGFLSRRCHPVKLFHNLICMAILRILRARVKHVR